MATPFKQRSQGSSFKMMGSSSPLTKPTDPKQETYSATMDAVTGDMDNATLRAMAVAQHKVDGKAKGSKFNISYAELIKMRNLKNRKIASSEPVVEKTATKATPKVTPVEDVVVEPKVEEGYYKRDQEIYDDVEKPMTKVVFPE